ncbi:MAG: dihydrofolate reductase family protein, partial [Myxococcales bacterium]|nr:dihydrofolate reductase family protein [Myxococcales bacterium]
VFTGPDADPGPLWGQRIGVPSGPGGVSVDAVLRALVDRGLHRVLVEGGAAVARSLLDAGRVDTVVQFVAGKLVPGGRGWVGGAPLGSLADAVELELLDVTRVGADARLRWRARRD